MIEAIALCVMLGFLVSVLVPATLWILEKTAKAVIWVMWQVNKAHGSTNDPWGGVR